MKLGIRITNQFKKDAQRMKKQGKDMKKLYMVIEKLANCQSLNASYKDHALLGSYADCRECHIAPDWLLIYRIDNQTVVLVLTRTGSHSDLFK